MLFHWDLFEAVWFKAGWKKNYPFCFQTLHTILTHIQGISEDEVYLWPGPKTYHWSWMVWVNGNISYSSNAKTPCEESISFYVAITVSYYANAY